MDEILNLLEPFFDEEGKIGREQIAQCLEEADVFKERARLAGEVEALTRQMEEREAEYALEQQRAQLRALLIGEGAKDPEYLLYRLFGDDSFSAPEALKDGEKWVQQLKEAFPEQFAAKAYRLLGVVPAQGESEAAMTRTQFEGLSYRERVSLYENDPLLYQSFNG